jgi:hypothetical protein
MTTSKSERPVCGAKTRSGGSCKARAVWDKANDKPRNKRCRMHGGLSTGPRTAEGLKRTLAAMRAGKAHINDKSDSCHLKPA